MKCMFLEKFFPTSRTATIKKEICGIRQHSGETLHEYWERFNKLCATCPHHHISEQLLIQYFCEGLTMMDQRIIDAASGGALVDKTPAETRHLISNMVSNTQQFGIREVSQPPMVNEIDAADNLRLENQLTELTSLQPEFVAYVLPWSSPPICAPRCKKLSRTSHRLVTSNLEFQQTMSSSNMQFQHNMNATTQDLNTQIGQLANIQLTLTNNSKPERKCECTYFEKQKRIALTSTPTLSRTPIHKCFNKTKLSHYRFQLGPSQQGSLNLMKSW
ncbi:hypothetical protein CR513_34957, partial [Mucuna pruriens]